MPYCMKPPKTTPPNLWFIVIVAFLVLFIATLTSGATPEWWRQEIGVQNALFVQARPPLPDDLLSKSPPPLPDEPEPIPALDSMPRPERTVTERAEQPVLAEARHHEKIDSFIMVSTTGCPPCIKWKKIEQPILQKAGWNIDAYADKTPRDIHLVLLPNTEGEQRDREMRRLLASLPKDWDKIAKRCADGEVFEMSDNAEFGIESDENVYVPLWLGYRGVKKYPSVIFVGYRTAAELTALRRGDWPKDTVVSIATPVVRYPTPIAICAGGMCPPPTLNLGAHISAGPLFQFGIGRNGTSYGLELFPQRGPRPFSFGFWATGR